MSLTPALREFAGFACLRRTQCVGTIVTPHGLLPALTRAISFMLARSTTETSFDGPFAETKEALLGFYLIDCDSLEEAIDIAKEIGRDENVVFEIRPVKLFLPKGKAS